jgi:hypothetical protein
VPACDHAGALKTGFKIKAIVVNPPTAGDMYDGSWDAWAFDWANRADLVAVWFFETPRRKAGGLNFPYSFYDLEPALLAYASTLETAPFSFSKAMYAWTLPSTLTPSTGPHLFTHPPHLHEHHPTIIVAEAV